VITAREGRKWDYGLRSRSQVLRSSIKGEVKEKHLSRGRSFSFFAARLIEQDLF
jgi:hypothetical protein